MTLRLFYYIAIATDLLDVIQVEPAKDFFELRDMVYARHEILFKCNNVDRDDLDLYAPLDLKVDPEEDLFERVETSIRSQSPLKLRNTVRNTFGENELDESLIHLVVAVRPDVVVPAKRSLPSVEDDLDRLKRSKVATTAPSKFAKLSEYIKNQENPSERILDDRPEPDLDVAPVALLYNGFGYFLDIFRGHKDVPGLDEVASEQIEQKVDNFAEKMAGFYDSEDERRDAGLSALNNIFSARTGRKFPRLIAASIGSVRSDGHFLGDHGAASLVVKFENEYCDNSTIPVVELTGYVAHSHKTAMEMKDHEELFRRWSMPCLGLTVVGPYVTFYAIIFAGDGDNQRALCAAFTAASVLLAHIEKDTANFVETPPENPHSNRGFPCISELPKFDSSDNELFGFRILRFHDYRQHYRLLYTAETTTDKKKIIVKFTRQYSIDLHRFCADRNRAPKILGFAKLPGGWFAIAMEYISSAVPLSNSPKLADRQVEWIQDLRNLVQSFHDAGLVHGDLRSPNIICNGDDVILIDFDWGGKDGEVSYPTYNLNPELIEGRASNDLKITKDDDNRVLEKTLEKIK